MVQFLFLTASYAHERSLERLFCLLPGGGGTFLEFGRNLTCLEFCQNFQYFARMFVTWIYFGNIWNILGHFEMFWNILEYFGKLWKTQEYFGIIWNILGYFEMFWNRGWVKSFWTNVIFSNFFETFHNLPDHSAFLYHLKYCQYSFGHFLLQNYM